MTDITFVEKVLVNFYSTYIYLYCIAQYYYYFFYSYLLLTVFDDHRLTVMIHSSGCQWVVMIVATFYNCSLNGIDDNNNSLYEPPHSVTIPSVSSGEIPLHACCEIQVRSTYIHVQYMRFCWLEWLAVNQSVTVVAQPVHY